MRVTKNMIKMLVKEALQQKTDKPVTENQSDYDRLSEGDPVKKLAILLHEKFCDLSHGAGMCGWDRYPDQDGNYTPFWENRGQQGWLKLTQRLLKDAGIK